MSPAFVRSVGAYGEDQDLSYPVPALAARAAKKENPFEVWGTGKQGRDFVHIDDVLDLTLLAMDKIKDGLVRSTLAWESSRVSWNLSRYSRVRGHKPTIKPLLDKPVVLTILLHDVGGREPRLESERSALRKGCEGFMRRR